MTSTFALALLVLATFLLYASRLGESPVHLHHEEASAGLQAASLAGAGRDADGRRLPLFIQIRDGVWLQPLPVYAMAIGLTVAPLSELAVRLPTVIVGTLDVVLMFFLARGVFKSDRAALFAAALMALTPAHFIHSRLALAAVYPVPFVVAWLLSLSLFLDRPRVSVLFLGTASLGIGFYSHPTSVLMMPLYLLLTWLAIAIESGISVRRYAVAAVGFILPLLLQVPWFFQYPRTYLDTVGRWGIHPAYVRHPLEGVRAAFNWGPLTERVSLFWDFFNPSYLFFVGGPNLVNSTRHAGVFLIPVAVFLAVGLWRVARRPPTMSLVLLLGLASAPLVAATFNEREAIGNQMGLLPFAILIATAGVEGLLAGRNQMPRIACVCLLVLVPIQFGYFRHDYFTGYRLASSAAFDGNLRGAVEAILAHQSQPPARPVFLSGEIPWIDTFWKFYLVRNHRDDLPAETTSFDAQRIDWDAVPPGSLVLGRAGDAQLETVAAAGKIRRLDLVTELDGVPAFAIFERSSREESSAPLVDRK